MSKKITNPIALLIALTMVLSLSLTGCGTKQEAPKDQTASTASTVSTSTTEPAKEKVKKPVALKILGPALEKAFPNGIQTDDVANKLVEKTGVTLDWTVANGISDIGTYISTLIASGDLPDIICNTDLKIRSQMLVSDSLIPLDDLLNTNGQSILKIAPVMIDIMRKYRSKNDDGKVYFLGTTVNEDYRSPNNLQGVPLIRWDLYKAIGMPEIQNHDVLLNVLKQMQDKFPTAPNGKKAYALSGFFGDWGYVMPFYFFANMNMAWANNFEYDWTNLDKAHSLIDPQSTQFIAAEFYNKAYKMGILDPDSMTMKFEQYKEKVAQGRVYCDIASWSSVDVYNPEAVKAGTPEKGFEPVPGWYADKPMALYQSMDAGFWEWSISKNCKDPDRAVDLFDYLFTYEGTELVMNGIEGKHWSMVDGKPQIADEVTKGEANDPDYRIKSGVAKYNILSGLGWSVLDPGGFPVTFKNSIDEKKKTLTEVDKDYCKTLNLGIPYQPWYGHKNATISGKYIALLPALSDPELIKINTDATDYWNNNYVKIIFAKEFAAARDKFIAEEKALGYDKLSEFYIGIFKELRKKFGE